MFKRRKIIKKLVIVLIVFAILLLINYTLKVRNVTCHTQFGICSNEFLNKLNNFKGKSIVVSPKIEDLDNQFAGDALYKSGQMQRRFPNTIDVTIQMRVPVGAVTNQNPKQIGLVDEDGRVISVVESTNMSILQIDTWSPDIKQLAPIHVSSLKTLQAVGQITKSPVIGQLTEVGLVVNSKQIPTIFIDTKSDNQQWYSTLQAIIDRSKIQNKMPKKIDLRFNQPVLEY